MSCEIIKRENDEFNDCLDMVCNSNGVYVPLDKFTQETYFNINVQNKKYPSCYQYNLLIMLAKRLINKENEKASLFKNRWHLDRKFLKEIANV